MSGFKQRYREKRVGGEGLACKLPCVFVCVCSLAQVSTFQRHLGPSAVAVARAAVRMARTRGILHSTKRPHRPKEHHHRVGLAEAAAADKNGPKDEVNAAIIMVNAADEGEPTMRGRHVHMGPVFQGL